MAAVSFLAMEEGLNERNVVAKVLSDADGRARIDCTAAGRGPCGTRSWSVRS